MATLAELEDALRNASAAADRGDAQAAADARALADAIVQMRGAAPAAPEPAPVEVPAPAAAPTEAPGLMERLERFTPVGLVTSPESRRELASSVAGLVRGAGTVGSTLVELARTGPAGLGGQPITTLPARAAERGAAITRGMEALGVDTSRPEPRGGALDFLNVGPFAGGQLAGEIAGTVGVGPALAPVLRGLGAAPAVVQAVQTGGIGAIPATTGMSLGRNVATRAAGGATAGAAGATLIEPTPKSAAVGGTVGGVLAPVAQAGVVGFKSLKAVADPLFQPQQAAEDALYSSIGGRADDAITALEKSRLVPTTPGFKLTLPERLLAGGMPPNAPLAALADSVTGASPKVLQETYESQMARVGALQGQLARIREALSPQGPRLAPVEEEQLRVAQSELLQQLDQEFAGLDIVGKAISWRLPVGVREPGLKLQADTRELDKLLRATVGRPEISQAITKAGDAQIDLSGIVARAEEVLGAPLAQWKGNQAAPNVARYLNEIQGAAPDQPVILGPGGAPITEPAAASTTLAKLDGLRKAIGADISDASLGVGALSPQKVGALKSLYASVWDTVDDAPLDQGVKDLYAKGIADFKNILVPKIRTGETAKLIQPTTFNETVIMPSQAVDAFMANEDTATQFVTSYAGQPETALALRRGIMAKFRKAAEDPNTKIIDLAAANRFLQENEAVFNILEQGGVGVRSALLDARRQAQNYADGFAELQALAEPFRKRTPVETIDYMLSDGARMKAGMDRLGERGQETVRRYLLERLDANFQADNPGAVLKELLTPNGTVKGAYKQALGTDVVDTLLTRAQDLRRTLDLVSRSPELKSQNAMKVWLDTNKFTPQELTDLSLLTRDIDRIRAVEEATSAGRSLETPDVQQLAQESTEMRGAKFQPQKIPSLSVVRAAINRAQMVVEKAVNRKARDQLAAIIYLNPDSAAEALRNAAARAAQPPRPRVSPAVVPAAAGAITGPTFFQPGAPSVLTQE